LYCGFKSGENGGREGKRARAADFGIRKGENTKFTERREFQGDKSGKGQKRNRREEARSGANVTQA